MNVEKMELIHQQQMIIMDEVHRVCEENGIEYYLIGGSALGVVRHSGFIPWDPDIDIAMTRENYKRFSEIANQCFKEEFEYRDYKNTPDLICPHALVYYKKAKVLFESDVLNDTPVREYLYIDIFPLDTAPASEKKQIKQAKKIIFYNKLINYKISRIYKKNSSLVKFGKKIIRIVLSPFSLYSLNKKRDSVMQKYNGEQSGFLCSMCSHYSYKKQCMPASIYGKPQLAKFEDRQYYIPENNHDYLTKIFKDYMKLPSKKQIEESYNLIADIIVEEG